MSSPQTMHKDIVIVGSGPAGLSFACALAKSGLQVVVIDQQSREQIANPAMDGRDIAMTHLSKTILQELNVWQRFHPEHIHPLREATVQDGDSPYALHFERSDDQEAPLGYLVANHRIRQALYDEVIHHPNIELLLEQKVATVSSCNTSALITLESGHRIEAPLAVAADSRFSGTRRMMGIGAKMKDYGRVMIVCNMKHQLDHRNTAQECFRYGRTCAILPLGELQSSIVITVPAARASELTDLSAEDFAHQVKDMLDHRLGAMELISERFAYPLVGAYSDRFIGKRFALIGDAAVGMHPVTAHGYNLGLRSADTLASQIIKAKQQGKDIGSAWVLHNYEARHQLLARPLYDSTNLIVKLYTDDQPVARLARKAALRIGNNISPFKKLITHRLTQIR
ncbi:MAG: 5-demethoxyubiquinol-8 5-hydroxylase UbiM [Candidatus Pelagadaptatus aseana]|uniref:5-demethoxyubiquinol-8 5-hydroxylase UbiM n=1 Tax=Candidatus Pelagadaptatus aseana TaxID=3120508 RepID=UPI0039B2F4F4